MSAFLPMLIYGKTHLGLTDGLQLMHAVHYAYMLNKIYVNF